LENKLQRENKGLSEVVSALILLVIAVLLAAVVTYYATNITLTRTNMEEARITKESIWVNVTGAVSAFKLQNLGGRDILINGIKVRGVEAQWSDIYYYRVSTGTTFTGELNRTSYAHLTGPSVTIDELVFNQSTSDIPLISSGVILFYIKGPSNIRLEDVGTTVNLLLYTNNAQYITEVNVESATSQ
jgi:flagellin-like protein